MRHPLSMFRKRVIKTAGQRLKKNKDDIGDEETVKQADEETSKEIDKEKSRKANEQSSNDTLVYFKAETSSLSNLNTSSLYNETNTSIERDSQAIRDKQEERKEKYSKTRYKPDYKPDYTDKQQSKKDIYTGKHYYDSYTDTKPTGPIRMTQNLRSTDRFDYAPDVCKDYKETGFCGYGDTCKFLHDRSDMKSGWELEAEYELELLSKQKGQQEEIEKDEKEEKKEDKCVLCFKECNARANCNCFYCFECAMKAFKRGKKCVQCGARLNGQINLVRR